jgi:hypothetical protein
MRVLDDACYRQPLTVTRSGIKNQIDQYVWATKQKCFQAHLKTNCGLLGSDTI